MRHNITTAPLEFITRQPTYQAGMNVFPDLAKEVNTLLSDYPNIQLNDNTIKRFSAVFGLALLYLEGHTHYHYTGTFPLFLMSCLLNAASPDGLTALKNAIPYANLGFTFACDLFAGEGAISSTTKFSSTLAFFATLQYATQKAMHSQKNTSAAKKYYTQIMMSVICMLAFSATWTLLANYFFAPELKPSSKNAAPTQTQFNEALNLFGLNSSMPFCEIKRIAKESIRRAHPDLFAGDSETAAKMIEAWKIIKNGVGLRP